MGKYGIKFNALMKEKTMNLYYTGICQLLDGKKGLEGDGYFVMTDDNRILYSNEAPHNISVVTVQDLEDALFEGCKHIINEFAKSENNSEVYAFNLYADEHNSFYIYMNTISGLNNTVKLNYSHYSYEDIQSLKYNQGDFAFQFYPSDMGDRSDIAEGFERIASDLPDLMYEEDEVDELSSNDVAVMSYEKKIFKDGHYLLALNAVKRLAASNEFNVLNKTEDFIYYAATGNDYVDYSVVMRKTIVPELFYNCFPDLKVKDEEFNSHLVHQSQKNVSECLDYWVEAFKSEFNEKSPYKYIKTEYDVFVSLESFGRELASECIGRLYQQLSGSSEVNVDEIFIYLKALEFVVDTFDDELINGCKLIVELLENQSDDVLISVRNDINNIIQVATKH